jgi:hypothetical protein
MPGAEVSAEDILGIGFDIAAYDDPQRPEDPENPLFSLSAAFGKKILNSQVQKTMLEWSGKSVFHGKKPDASKGVFLFESIKPLLDIYRDKLTGKICPFHPASVTKQQVSADIAGGDWFRIRLGFELSEAYQKTFQKMSLGDIFGALKVESSQLMDLLAPHIRDRSDESIRKVYQELLANRAAPDRKPSHRLCLALFEAAYAQRLNHKQCGYLFDGIEQTSEVVAGMKLLEKMGVKISTRDILTRNPDGSLSSDLLEIDLGL